MALITGVADSRSWRERLDSGVELQNKAVLGIELLERPSASMPPSRVYSFSSVMMLMTRALTGQEKSENQDCIYSQRNSTMGIAASLTAVTYKNSRFTFYLLKPTKIIGYKMGRIMPRSLDLSER
jgi:hypothetical protein